MRKISLMFIAASFILVSAAPLFAKSQDIIKVNSNIEIARDMVVNDVLAVGGDVIVYGKAEGSVTAVGGSVTLKPGSFVKEEVVIVGGNLIKEEGAAVGGKVTQIFIPRFIPSYANILKGGWIALWAAVSMLVLLGFLGLAILLVALIPHHIGVVVNLLEKSFVSMLLWGMLWMVLIVPIAVVLAISIIGVILIPVEILLVALAFIIGYIASAIWIGKTVLLYFRKITIPFVDAILGIVILFIVGLIPIVGFIIKSLFVTAGFGAVIKTRFGTVK